MRRRPANTNTPNDATPARRRQAPWPRGSGHGRRVEGQSEAQTEAAHQRAGQHCEEDDVDQVEQRRVYRQEARQVVAGVARCGAIEEQEIDHLRSHRRQHLIREQERQEAGEQLPERRPGDHRRADGLLGSHLREAVFGEQQEAQKRELRRGRREQQVLGRSEQRQQRDLEQRRRPGSPPRTPTRLAGRTPSSGARRAAGRPARRGRRSRSGGRWGT